MRLGRSNPVVLTLLAAALWFAASSGISYLVLSDGFGLPGVRDGIRRVGAPLSFWESGGFAYHETFRPVRFGIDVVFALGFGVIVVGMSRRSKHGRLGGNKAAQ